MPENEQRERKMNNLWRKMSGLGKKKAISYRHIETEFWNVKIPEPV